VAYLEIKTSTLVHDQTGRHLVCAMAEVAVVGLSSDVELAGVLRLRRDDMRADFEDQPFVVEGERVGLLNQLEGGEGGVRELKLKLG
jgi:hypothetical protein